MGIHLGLRCKEGKVRLGDAVFVGVPQEEEPLYSPPQLHRWSSCDHDTFPVEKSPVVTDIDYPDSSSSGRASTIPTSTGHVNLVADLANLE